MDAESWVAVDEYEKNLQKKVIEWLKEFPPAELGTNLAEVSTDTISRQAAIEALGEQPLAWEHGEYEEGLIAKWESDVEAIKNLPPAHPDNQVHLCDSCSYTYPECPSVYTDMIFGNGTGNDNICACSKYLPSAQPEQHIDADGTLWITVPDIGRVTRVIVDEEKSKFCRQFYMDAQPEQHHDEWCTDCKEYDTDRHCCPRWNRVIRQTLADAQPQRTGKWIKDVSGTTICSECKTVRRDVRVGHTRFCNCCGAKMEGVSE